MKKWGNSGLYRQGCVWHQPCVSCVLWWTQGRASHTLVSLFPWEREGERESSGMLGKVHVYSLVPSIFALKITGRRIFLELSLCHIRTVFTERTALLNPTRELKESWVLFYLFLVCHNLNVIWNVSAFCQLCKNVYLSQNPIHANTVPFQFDRRRCQQTSNLSCVPSLFLWIR